MKKKMLVLLGMLMVLMVLMVSMTGCGKELTLEEIIAEMQEFDENSDSMEATSDMEVSGKISIEGVEIDIYIDSDMAILAQKTDFGTISYMNGEMQVETMGQERTEVQETYVLSADGLDKKYNCVNGIWTYEEEDAVDSTNIWTDFYKNGSDFVLSEEHVEKNGIECYEIKGKISGEALENFVGAIESASGEAIDYSSLQVDIALYASVEDCSVREVWADMKPVIEMIMDMPVGEASFDECYILIRDVIYDKEVSLAVPEEAIKAETVKEIMDKVVTAETEEGTMECVASMEMAGEMSVEGQTVDMSILVDMDYKAQHTEESDILYMLVDGSVSAMGQAEDIKTESYIVQNGDTVRTYTPMDSQWFYTEQPAAEVPEDVTALVEDVYSGVLGWTLVDENAEKNGKACYELQTNLQGEDIQTVIQMAETMGVGNTGMDFGGSEVTMMMYIAKDTYEIVELSVDMKEFMETAFESLGVNYTFDVCALSMKDIVYNSGVEIVLPEEVLAAQEAVYEAPTDETTGADEARLAEITKAGEYIMEMEGWPEMVRIEWPDGYECVYAIESDYLQFATYYNYVDYDFYNKELYEEYNLSDYMDEIISNYQLQADAYPELQVSDLQTMELEGGTCEYYKVSYMYEGLHPNTCYHAMVKLGDNYVMVSTDFMSELDMQEHFEKIINGISLVK